jgi:hypothetical protein
MGEEMIVFQCNNCREMMHDGAFLTLTPRSGLTQHFCSWRCVEVLAANHGV